MLERLGVTDEAVRGELLLRHLQDDRPSEGALPFKEEGKTVLERSRVAAKELGDSRIQAEHVLFALLSTEPSRAANLLGYLGARASRLQREALRVATGRRGSAFAAMAVGICALGDLIDESEPLRRSLVAAVAETVRC